MTTDPLTLAVAFGLCVLGVARATRLVVHDDWPPMIRARLWYINATGHGGWSLLILCPFCVAPYLAAVSIAWAWIGNLDPVWWVVHLWASISYLAAMVTLRDEPPAEPPEPAP